MRKNKDGFTLIELMIVIAIIAIIAAIAIPGLLASQRASNERSASASLKTVATAEADFRANDRDSNKIQDFLTADISGLYGLLPVASSEMIKLIEISVAGADFNWVGGTSAPSIGTIRMLDTSFFTINSAKAGYWYQAMINDEAGNPYRTVTSGVAGTGTTLQTVDWYNTSKFGFMAFPDSFSAGRNAFFLNENNTIFKRPCTAPVKPSAPGGTIPVSGTGLVGAWPAEDWPDDTNLKSQYSKLD